MIAPFCVVLQRGTQDKLEKCWLQAGIDRRDILYNSSLRFWIAEERYRTQQTFVNNIQ